MDAGNADDFLVAIKHVLVVAGGGVPGVEALLGALVAGCEVLSLKGVRVVVARELHPVPGPGAGREIGALYAVVGEKVVMAHVLGVVPGGLGEGIREEQGWKVVVFAVLVYDLQELKLLGVV